MRKKHLIVLVWAGVFAISTALVQAQQRPIPRTADGKPDLSGIWKTATASVGAVQPTPWGADMFGYNKLPKGDGARAELDPLMHCYRPGLARIGPPLQVPNSSIRVRFEGESVPFPGGASQFDVVEIRYAPKKIWMVYQFNQESRQIFMDGREHPEVFEEDLLTMWWNGHSVGKWDGDTLVVDTVAIRNETWLNNMGYEHRNLQLTERIRRLDADTLEIERTFTDPIALARPYVTKATMKLTPNHTFVENVVCDQYYVRKVGFGFGGLLGINAHPWQAAEENPNATWEDVEREEAESGGY
jgi:hypothetical protein